eukprot:CAMPEP_0175043446 /NCGR_PEP_ID=MMETSP0052_2-20121109/3193_1 /TAXON_ID=51329 ORGANISM="Polytomella parva, Strain SAG 63-3" /NCGR_SAMPLE_ID=MMETSP0052_2 /ASSEMBLY_ACC=CAM_ASM_000194 /LENGTH=358 /DNA_ID=CAMNT_0016306509 /DNA_START=409 /DNA_END=1485 /DNA_ORIENTATION=+
MQRIVDAYDVTHPDYRFQHFFLSVVEDPLQRSRPPLVISEAAWRQALEAAGGPENPDKLWPIEAKGASDLIIHAQQQRIAATENMERLAALKDVVGKLDARVALECRDRITTMQAQQGQLMLRLLRVFRIMDHLETLLVGNMGFSTQQIDALKQQAAAATANFSGGVTDGERGGNFFNLAGRMNGSNVSNLSGSDNYSNNDNNNNNYNNNDSSTAAIMVRLARQLAEVEATVAPLAPQGLPRRLEAVSAAAAAAAASQSVVAAKVSLDSASQVRLFQVLKEHADGIKRLQDVLKTEQSDVQVLRELRLGTSEEGRRGGAHGGGSLGREAGGERGLMALTMGGGGGGSGGDLFGFSDGR